MDSFYSIIYFYTSSLFVLLVKLFILIGVGCNFFKKVFIVSSSIFFVIFIYVMVDTMSTRYSSEIRLIAIMCTNIDIGTNINFYS
jgi:hypothetical protein